jgi:hypothetical protein
MTEDTGKLLSAPLPDESPPPAAEASAVVRLSVAVVAKLNLADFQNAVPALREIVVVNETVSDIAELTLTVTSEPPFLKTRTWSLDAVRAGETFHLTDLDVQSDGSLLSRLASASARGPRSENSRKCLRSRTPRALVRARSI